MIKNKSIDRSCLIFPKRERMEIIMGKEIPYLTSYIQHRLLLFPFPLIKYTITNT